MGEVTNDFGFKVRYHIPQVFKESYLRDIPGGWSVSLPHQCDRWDIAGGPFGPATQEAAIRDLKMFIAEANVALAALEKGEQHNLTDTDRYLDEEDARSS